MESCCKTSWSTGSSFAKSGIALVNWSKHWDSMAMSFSLSLVELIKLLKALLIQLRRFCIFEIAELSSSMLNCGVFFWRWSIRTTRKVYKFKN
ncbi:hypothetical protein T4C_4791 [Trichinella pseudospiralis]|uniref:Uncharacterized protein n=1 Tax=Trichinella pseudospiralis TaxID=6337 RepID=A0A0V1JVY7_TRIPS|nr:hypothetical protein T4C_4791 [Trichinella pseudospiralis]